LYGSSTVNGYDGAVLPSEPYYVLNSSRTLDESVPEYLRNKKGPFGSWRGNDDRCTLSWTFFYWTICTKQPDGSLLIQGGVGKKTGNVTFSIRPGATLPHDAIANYKGCPVAALAEKIGSETASGCPDTDASPALQPCELVVQPAAASSIASAVKPATTTFTGLPTSTGSSSQSTSSSGSNGNGGNGNGGGGGGNSGNTKSSAGGLSVNAGLGLVIGILMMI
jgi:uncharacterized membrane protein YgcG